MFFPGASKTRLSQTASLKALRNRGVEIASVIDVGVQRQTASLVECFPDKPHLLIEPVSAFHADIARNYRDIRHKAVTCAASDEDGAGRLQLASIEGGNVTHAHLSQSGEEVVLRRLDTLLPEIAFPAPYLLKIDVDSTAASIKVLDGARGAIDAVSCIICEVVARDFVRLVARIEEAGFALWDVVDVTYYDDVFYQCDVIFIRRTLIAADDRLKPFRFDAFDPKKWRVIRG
ncbi:MAG: FkbM family methyltransferase [Parvularculaceae bacterium]|nr:hypothetical protein [Parvularculaceae bacterium]